MEINLKLTLQDIELLNNFIQNSVPNLKFKDATAFIAKLQSQIKQELEKHETIKN